MRRIPIIGALAAAFLLFFATAPAYANDIQTVTADGCTTITVTYAHFPTQPTAATTVVTRGDEHVTDVEDFAGNGHVTVDVSALAEAGATTVTVDWNLDGQHHHYGTTLDTSCVPPTTTTSTVPETSTSTSVPETSTSVSTSVPTTTTLVPTTTTPEWTWPTSWPTTTTLILTTVPPRHPAPIPHDDLPNTGSDTTPLFAAGAVAVLSGLAAVGGTRRRRR